jgi:hypothetical protein
VSAPPPSDCYGYFTADPGWIHSERPLHGDFVALVRDALKMSVWIGQAYQGRGSAAHRLEKDRCATLRGLRQGRPPPLYFKVTSITPAR